MTQEELNEKIAELEKKIEELKQEKIEDEKGWKPKFDGEYYYFCLTDDIISCTKWIDFPSDEISYSIGNCFKTKEEAEEFGKKLTTQLKYKKYIQDHSEPLDWEDTNQKKCYLDVIINDNELSIDFMYFGKDVLQIYASSEQIIKDAIEYIGKDNVKYLFE